MKGRLLLSIGVVLAVVIIVSAYVISSHSAPRVEKGDTIYIYYTGRLTNGTIFDSNVGGQALQFTVGAGQVIAGMDSGVIGMSLGVPKTLVIPYNEAYGAMNPNLIVNFPVSAFSNKSVTVGERVAGNMSGRVMQGTVTAVNGTYATVNFNQELAGQTLIFNLTVVKLLRGSSCFSVSQYASC